MKHHSALILVGFLAIGGAIGCGARDESPGEAVSNAGAHASDPTTDDTATATATKSCCGGAETDTDATVYVSPNGFDEAPGTQEAPVLTLAHAIRLAAARGHRVAVIP